MDDFDFIPGDNVPFFTTSTAAPKLDEKPQPKKKSTEKTIAPAKSAEPVRLVQLKKIALAMALTIIISGMLSTVIYLNRLIVDNNKTISTLTSEVNQAKAESVRLNASLNAMVSADKIQEYAVTVLGMQKAERYQIHYFDDRDGDKVVISDGKALNADAQS